MGVTDRVRRSGPRATSGPSTGGLPRRDLWVPLALVAADYVNTYVVHRGFATQPDDHGDRYQLIRGFLELGVVLAVIALTLAVRRQSWRTVGFGTAHLRRSLLVGAVPAALLLAGGWLLGAAQGMPANSWRVLTFGVPFYLVVVAFTEEVFWRGFLTTRLATAFPGGTGVLLAGVLFGFLHLVGSFGESGFGWWVVAANWWRVVIPFALHLLSWWLYRRYDSLAAPTLVHMAINLSGDLRGGAFYVPA